MDLGLQDKVAFVAGASRGLGFATAQRLAEEGAFVAINGRNAEKLTAAATDISTQTGQKVIPAPGDLSLQDSAEKAIQQTIESFGRLDLLVTNAGGPPAGIFSDFDDYAWQNAVELTFLSSVRLIRAALPYLKKSAAAAILTITSYVVKQPHPGLILSNSLRAATIGLTKSLALELGPSGIRVNSILPGWTMTQRVTELLTVRANNNRTSLEEEIRKQAQESALGRMATPDEFARAAVFLLSPAASYITGAMLNVDGGAYKGTW